MNAESGLGTVITEGLPLKGTVSRFDCKDDQYVVCLKDDGEAAVAYGVFFDTGDGTEVDPQYILANEQKAEKPEDQTLKNATFEDWYLEDSLYDFGTVITRSITLEAKWNYDVIGETDFTLPSSLSVIRAYAFGGLQGKTVMLPAVGDAQVVHVIRKDAFAGCKNMKVIIPGGWRIESGAFDGCTDMVLFGPVGGAADIYAAAHPDTCSFCPEN